MVRWTPVKNVVECFRYSAAFFYGNCDVFSSFCANGRIMNSCSGADNGFTVCPFSKQDTDQQAGFFSAKISKTEKNTKEKTSKL